MLRVIANLWLDRYIDLCAQISNVLPVLLGPLIVRAHIATAWLWIVVTLVNTSNSHSGYHFPAFPSPEQHDFHHLK